MVAVKKIGNFFHLWTYQGSNRDALFVCQNRDGAPVDPQYEFRCQRGSGLVVAEEGLQLNENNPQDFIVTQTNP